MKLKIKVRPGATETRAWIYGGNSTLLGCVAPELAEWIREMANLHQIANTRNEINCGGKCGCCILVDELGSATLKASRSRKIAKSRFSPPSA